MGSSIYQVGWQGAPTNVPTEIVPLSHAYNESRRLALGRLLEEAQLAGADAVVGVRIEQGATTGPPAPVSSSLSAPR